MMMKYKVTMTLAQKTYMDDSSEKEEIHVQIKYSQTINMKSTQLLQTYAAAAGASFKIR